ncbi:MAG: PfkB family carbohydrate kinase [Bacilli bacterium]
MKKKVLVFGLVGDSLFMKTDHFHQPGETIVVDEIHKELGGKGFNQAVAIKKMKVDVGFLGTVGNDEIGMKSKAYLQNLNIDDYIIVKDNANSSFATILTDNRGNNQVSVYPEGAKLLTTDDIDRYEYLFDEYEYILIQFELDEHITSHIVKLSQKHHNKLIINPAPYHEWGLKYLKEAYLITPNFNEASQIFNYDGNSVDKLLKIIKDNYFTNTIVTIGKEGALLVTKTSVLKMPLIDHVKALDTTGAGDEFTGTLIAMLIKGNTIEAAVAYANFASMLSVQKPYVLDSYAEIEDLKELTYVTDDEYSYHGFNNVRYTVRCFIEKDNKIAMLKIQGEDLFGKRNHLETSGGGIEPGETKEEAVKREIKEETGYEVTNINFLGYFIHEACLIQRLTYAYYYVVTVNDKANNLNLNDYEKDLFKGLSWYQIDELEEVLKHNNQYKCDRMVHKRELLALELLRKHLMR